MTNDKIVFFLYYSSNSPLRTDHMLINTYDHGRRRKVPLLERCSKSIPHDRDILEWVRENATITPRQRLVPIAYTLESSFMDRKTFVIETEVVSGVPRIEIVKVGEYRGREIWTVEGKDADIDFYRQHVALELDSVRIGWPGVTDEDEFHFDAVMDILEQHFENHSIATTYKNIV